MLHSHTLSLWGWISVCSPYSKLAWMSFSSIIQKAKGRLPALSLVHCRIERKHIRLIILPQEGAKAWCKHIHRSPEKVSESLKGKMVGISFQKSVTKDWVKWVLLKMQRQQCKTLRKIKKKKKNNEETWHQQKIAVTVQQPTTKTCKYVNYPIVVVQSLSHVWLCKIP